MSWRLKQDYTQRREIVPHLSDIEDVTKKAVEDRAIDIICMDFIKAFDKDLHGNHSRMLDHIGSKVR